MNPVTVSERANAGLIEEYYQRWLDNPDSVDPTWRAFFQGFTLGSNGQAPTGAPAGAVIDASKQAGVYDLINAYRAIGHIQARLDPLSAPRPPPPLCENTSVLTRSMCLREECRKPGNAGRAACVEFRKAMEPLERSNFAN